MGQEVDQDLLRVARLGAKAYCTLNCPSVWKVSTPQDGTAHIEQCKENYEVINRLGDEMRHTPFPWSRYDTGGTATAILPGGHDYTYGPQSADWVWGPKGPGYGIVSDGSPGAPCTTESIANAKLIAAIPELVGLLKTIRHMTNTGPMVKGAITSTLRDAGIED
jgi:hypothetical protein